MSGFTQGEWVVGNRHTNSGVYAKGGRLVATTSGHSQNFNWETVLAENMANAHLIAAAPDMYDALIQAELASRELCEGQDPENQCWVTLEDIRAALRKARGEDQ